MNKVKTVIIEEFVNVDETFQNIKNIKVGSMTLNDLFGDNLKVIEKALEERKELLKWKNSQQDLIKGKDEYIAKLCNDRAELKEHEKELIAEQHRLFDLAKEQEEALKIIVKKGVAVGMRELKEVGLKEYNDFIGSKELELTQAEFDLVKKVVEKYGKS